MKPSGPFILAVLVALGGIEPGPGAAQESSMTLARLSLAGPAKRYCSGIWVSGRDRQEALHNSVLLDPEAESEHENGRLRFDVDEDRRIVTASRGEASARARHVGDQGCVILPEGTTGVFFTPREVESSLPDADATPWPMGDRRMFRALGLAVKAVDPSWSWEENLR